MSFKELFEKLSKCDVSNITKVVQKQKYIPWNLAWKGVCKEVDNISYIFIEDKNGLPFFSSNVGIIVKTSITIDSYTLSMTRPVLNSANKAMKEESYEYFVKEYVNGRPTGKLATKTVAAAVMTDINEAMMRCLVKNIAMFGYGINLYTGELHADPDTIDSNQLSELTIALAEKKLTASVINNAFGINKLSELMSYNFESAKDIINKGAVK